MNIASPRPWADLPRDGYNSGNHGTADQDNAPNLTSPYSEEYDYDAAGNMLTMRHNRYTVGAGGGWQTAWSRRFGMDGRSPDAWRSEVGQHTSGEWANPPSNRLTHVEDRASDVATPPAVAQSHWYDANGNMMREHIERSFEWDHADRMKAFRNQTSTSRPTTYALYLYDATGMRVKKLVVNGGDGYRTTTYLGASFEHHVEQKLDDTRRAENCSLHVMDGQSRIAILRVGPAFADDGAAEHLAQYHLGDHLGSSSMVLTGGGGRINREEFFAFGETSFGCFGRKRFRFTGKERDEESGLSYHATRHYASALVRWITADPLGAADGSNLYRYAHNSPLRFSDASGMQAADQSATSSGASAVQSHRVCEACHGVPNSTGPYPAAPPESLKTRAGRAWEANHDLRELEAMEGFDNLTASDLQDIGVWSKQIGAKPGDDPVYEKTEAMYRPETYNSTPGDFGKIALAAAQSAQVSSRAMIARDVGVMLSNLAFRVRGPVSATRDSSGTTGKTTKPPQLPDLNPRPAAPTSSPSSSAIVPIDQLIFDQVRITRNVAGYDIWGISGRYGDTYSVSILHVGIPQAARGNPGAFLGLTNALRAEAAASGSSKLLINGLHIVNPSFTGISERLLTRLGFEVVSRPVGGIVVSTPIPSIPK